ncbi:PREDICTED: putative leucine-rich repeat receptor-like serine/threonine-protein kinase At2g24130 [Theobroma cacao]|uniref:Leucine-rich repeat receptor-like serine/threonine-protein kinase At2g24130 n=1 Tax=Theobroma cacao TaxID=3641 RepID=A0AB32WLG3_THECC|nr:PREDICTED: putative leucine-rich repeat receptor-like serine/threonine-protein kinase At2g24130 [Theobroma cacao]
MFDLSHNSFSGDIPNNLRDLRDLQVLNLQDNNLAHSPSSPKLSFLPSLAHYKDLRMLNFYDNPFIDGKLPISIGNLSISLEELDVSHCNIRGNIPREIGNLINLINLYIANNALIGTIPTTIERLEKLQRLFLDDNTLEGSIQFELCHLKNLGYLYLIGNKLSEPILECLGDIVSLRHLYLGFNEFANSIPSTFTRLIDILQPNLSSNFLSGALPIDIGRMYGSILELFGGLIGLEFLDLSRNNFFGIIPKSLQKLLHLKYLNVSYNRLRRKHSMQKIGRENSIGLAIWRRISYQELHQATNGFCDSKLLGAGSFGSIYQGTFLDGLNIVIKVFNLEVEGSFKSFGVECDFLRNIRHGNLVTIISNCYNVDFKALILEFMPNGSLEKWLYSHNYFPDILHRLNIMIDVASPFDYFYHGDFGIAKLLGEKDSKVQTITLATIGYMASEYETQGVVSIKNDAYSFGILLIETLTRKKPTDEITKEREHFAIKDCALSSLQLALECSKELPEEGIDMKNVVAKLKKIKIKFLKDLNR